MPLTQREKGDTMRITTMLAAATIFAAPLAAQDITDRIIAEPAEELAPKVQAYASILDPVFAITDVRIIDGTGAAPVEGQTVLIRNGRIAAIGDETLELPDDIMRVDGTGKTLLPGLVGMHDHFFYVGRPRIAEGGFDGVLLVDQMIYSAPKMYLAKGVTTLRTTGSVMPFNDIRTKEAIDAGQEVGPHVDATASYVDGEASLLQMVDHHEGVESVRQHVAYWADRGATSFKAYMWLKPEQLGVLIEEAHARGIKVTGHLCATDYPEAADLGIDNLEHGFFDSTHLAEGHEDGVCDFDAGFETLAQLSPDNEEGRSLIAHLIEKGVAVTSTLPILESESGNLPVYDELERSMLTPQALKDYDFLFAARSARSEEQREAASKRWANALAMEKAFFDAGGLLLAGPDPTGAGDVLPGFGNIRALELLVDAGLTPLEAIRVGTYHGALYLGAEDRIGSIAIDLHADLLLVEGNPAEDISALGNTVTVFKDGVGYDPDKLLEAAKGYYGRL